MSKRSGRWAVVDGQSTVRQWGINILSEPKPYVASNTRGGTGRVRGVRDWNGSFGAYGHTPLLLPGEFFEFSGYTAPSDDTEGGSGPIYTGPAIVDSLALVWNWGSGDIQSYTVNFSGNGEVEESDGTMSDVTEPTVPPFDDVSIFIDEGDDEGSGSGSFAEWCDLVSATLTLSSPNKSSVNSCSGGWRTRSPGPIDWTLSVSAEEVSRIALPFDIGDDVRLRIKVGDGENDRWLLRWAHVVDMTGLTLNRETGDYAQMTINFGMAGFVNGQTGLISAPGATQWWPFS
jgi:hypothetical protein